jgi:hypothetical protein
MLSALIIGASGTAVGTTILYKGYSYIRSGKSEPSLEDFLKFQDVRSTLITVNNFLLKHPKEYNELRKQHKLITRYVHDIDQLVKWRKEKYYRHFTYTGENELVRQLKEEWIIFKVRIRVISGLNTLELYH